MGELAPLFLVLPVLLVASGLASGSETALFSLSHADRARLRRETPAIGAAVDAMLGRPRALLIFVLLLNMSVNVSYFVVTSVISTQIGSGLVGTVVGVGSVLSIILFGEVLAKMLARAQRVAFCRLIAVPMRAGQVAIGPVLMGLDALVIAPLARLVGGGRERPLNSSEVAALVRAGGDGVHLTAAECRVLEEVVGLKSRRVRDVMKPRVRMGWVTDDASVEDVREAVAKSGKTVIVVRRGSGEGPVVGVLHVKPYLSAIEMRRGGVPMDRYCDPPQFIPETARLDDALSQIRRRSAGMLLCVDEHGAVTGWLEPEDIADELLRGLGEDEQSEGAHPSLVGLGRWHVPGSARLHELERQFGFDHGAVGGDDSARATTVAGLIAESLGRVPGVGDSLEVGPIRLSVLDMVGRRVERVELELIHGLDGHDDVPADGGEGVSP